MWNVADVRSLGYGLFGTWDAWDVGWSGCGMFRMWNVPDVRCLEYGMFGMWEVRDVGCGMWDVF